jgi:hypothetical protein
MRSRSLVASVFLVTDGDCCMESGLRFRTTPTTNQCITTPHYFGCAILTELGQPCARKICELLARTLEVNYDISVSQAESRDKSPENLNNDAVPALSDYLRVSRSLKSLGSA